MTIKEIMSFCEGFSHATWDYPFDKQTRCYRVGGKIFAMVIPEGAKGALTLLEEDQNIPKEEVTPMLTLSCDPLQGDFYKIQYKNAVKRPYHTPKNQQPYGITVLIERLEDSNVLKDMIEHSYSVCLKKLPKYKQKEILGQ